MVLPMRINRTPPMIHGDIFVPLSSSFCARAGRQGPNGRGWRAGNTAVGAGAPPSAHSGNAARRARRVAVGEGAPLDRRAHRQPTPASPLPRFRGKTPQQRRRRCRRCCCSRAHAPTTLLQRPCARWSSARRLRTACAERPECPCSCSAARPSSRALRGGQLPLPWSCPRRAFVRSGCNRLCTRKAEESREHVLEARRGATPDSESALDGLPQSTSALRTK